MVTCFVVFDPCLHISCFDSTKVSVGSGCRLGPNVHVLRRNVQLLLLVIAWSISKMLTEGLRKTGVVLIANFQINSGRIFFTRSKQFGSHFQLLGEQPFLRSSVVNVAEPSFKGRSTHVAKKSQFISIDLFKLYRRKVWAKVTSDISTINVYININVDCVISRASYYTLTSPL